MDPEILSTGLFIAATLCIAMIAVWGTSWVLGIGPAPPVVRPGMDATHIYEFRDGYLTSPVPTDDPFFDPEIDRAQALAVAVDLFGTLHPDLAARLEALTLRREAFVLTGRLGDDCLSVAGHAEEDRLILTIGPAGAAGGARQLVDMRALGALQDEVEDLRSALDQTPALMWKLDASGRVIWANAPYFAAVDAAYPEMSNTWPLPRLFGNQTLPLPRGGERTRLRIDPDASTGLYEVTGLTVEAGTSLYFAEPADRLVQSEDSLRSFIQTLSKTFAALPIGMAVFDRKRELVMFNPALVALSTLGVEFLSARPGLTQFLDQLREAQRMPEPRNYRSWRDEIAAVEEGAANGTYHEMWTLPSGQTYRVTGRPHPDGAVAFLFEDLTTEVSLTRQFRADLEMYQSVLDAAPEALAVFDRAGRMITANTGYIRLWEQDPREGAVSLQQATSIWSMRCEKTAIWDAIAGFVAQDMNRVAWADTAILRDGTSLVCHVTPMSGRTTLVKFTECTIELEELPGFSQAASAPLPLAEPDMTVQRA